jgi:hypothetical protein
MYVTVTVRVCLRARRQAVERKTADAGVCD